MSETRQKLIESANRRFYRDGFRNVGLDQLLADVFGVEADSFTDRAGRRVLSPVALVRH